jgi:hypothetical protein
VTGSLPDTNLSLDFMDLIGKLEIQANIASRAGQYEDLHGLARELTEWQKRLRRAFVLALGETDVTVAWGPLVNQVAQVRHERDTAQTLHSLAAEDLRQYNIAFTRAKADADELRAQREADSL